MTKTKRQNIKKLPGQVVRGLEKTFGISAPRPFRQTSKICQLYIGAPETDPGIKTFITLINFPSFFIPGPQLKCRYFVNLFIDGKATEERTIDLNPYGSAELDLQEFLQIQIKNETLGLVSVSMKPLRLLKPSQPDIGTFFPHFFVRYESLDGKSLALIHPQVRLDERELEKTEWNSNYLLPLSQLNKIEAYQINPSDTAVASNLLLKEATTERVIHEQPAIVPAYGVRRAVWDCTPFRGINELGKVAVINLTAPNAKPLLLCHYPNGVFYGLHS